MAHNQRRNSSAGPARSVMNIRAANSARLDAYQNIVVTGHMEEKISKFETIGFCVD